MSRDKGSDRDAAKWLESPEGQKWSRGRHDKLSPRDGGMGKTGVFGEFKTDYEDCLWTGRCKDHKP